MTTNWHNFGERSPHRTIRERELMAVVEQGGERSTAGVLQLPNGWLSSCERPKKVRTIILEEERRTPFLLRRQQWDSSALNGTETDALAAAPFTSFLLRIPNLQTLMGRLSS